MLLLLGGITEEEERKRWPRLARQKGREETERSRRNARRTMSHGYLWWSEVHLARGLCEGEGGGGI